MLLKIINTSWTQQKTPEDWSRGLITPVHKKGDKLDPANYRPITLLSMPGKVFCRMVLTRIQETTDSHLTEEQCGFRSARGTTDATFIVRQQFEKSKERLTPIHGNVVDFRAAFDIIWREALWKCLRSKGVDKVLVELVEYMYNQSKCAIIVNGKISEWFKVMTGVRQGCPLSPSLFNLFLELIMKDVRNLDSGVQMGHMHLNNIRYADDTTLLDHDVGNLEITTDKLEQACRKWGMKINTSKCKVISNDKKNITINGEAIEIVDKFTFLGSIVPAVADDVQRSINLAAWAFGRLREKNLVYPKHL